MITDEEAERAANFILESAPKFAEMKAHRIQLEHALKVTKAREFLQVEGTVAEREAIALTSKSYDVVLEGLREAAEEENKLSLQIKAAETRVDIWRTQQANRRV